MRHICHAAVAVVALLLIASPATACVTATVAFLERLATMPEPPPPTKCGSQRNEFVRLAFLKDWKGALAAYEAHLASSFGRLEAETEDARATLHYLRRKAAGN